MDSISSSLTEPAGAAPLSYMEKLEPHLLKLHGAMEIDELWEATRDLLRTALPCKRVTLFLGHLGLGEARQVKTYPDMENTPTWFEERGKLNPYSPYIEANPGIPMYRFSDITGPVTHFRKTEFYRRFAKVEGWDKGLSGMFWDGKDMRAMFSLYRGTRQKEFSDAEMAHLRELMPLIEVAMTRVQRLHRERSLRRVFEEFNRTMPLPVLLLDWKETLVFANQEAYRACAYWNYGSKQAKAYNYRDAFRVPGRILEAIRKTKEEIMAIPPKNLDRFLFPKLTINHPSIDQMKAVITVASAGRSLARPGFFVLFEEALSSRRKAEPTPFDNLPEMRQLTPSEREVTRLICEGNSNQEIAQTLNKSVLTVKTQVNAIFRKLGVTSRTRLVAKLK